MEDQNDMKNQDNAAGESAEIADMSAVVSDSGTTGDFADVSADEAGFVDSLADDDTTAEAEQVDENPPPRTEIFEWTQAVVFSVVLIVMLFVTCIRMIGVEGPSMMETLHEGDRIALSSLFYTPAQGDIVVVREQEFMVEPIVKRIIAVGGQTVDIDFESGVVYVGKTGGVLKPMDEPYIRNSTIDNYGTVFPLDVPEGHVFIMGDNRQQSKDSRHSGLGIVDNRCIIGRVLFRVYPFGDIGFVK